MDKIVPGVLLEILDVWILLLLGKTGEAITYVEFKHRQLRINFRMGCLIFITATIFFYNLILNVADLSYFLNKALKNWYEFKFYNDG